jgi:hypothetical protein
MAIVRHGRSGLTSLAAAATALVVAATALTAEDTGGTWSAGLGSVANQAGSGNLAHTHTYTGGACAGGATVSAVGCPGAISPTGPTAPSPSVLSKSNSIQYTGTTPATRVVEQARADSCGPVAVGNSANAANPMVSRYNTAYSTTAGPMPGSGSITLDGANPGGYAASIVAQAQPNPPVSLGTQVGGVGMWFKAPSTSRGGPLFGFGTSPINLSGATDTNDRILYLDAMGRIGFAYGTGATASTAVSDKDFRDGSWHFAYVAMSSIKILVLGLSFTVQIFVDGVSQVDYQSPLGASMASYVGYWHVGWSPVSTRTYGSGLPNYFVGSLSNFVVLNTAPAPANLAPTATTTQAAFDASVASSVTEHWPLNDSGTTTTALPLPVLVGVSPCAGINLSWGFTGPTSCAWAPQSRTAPCTSPPATSVSEFVTNGWQAVASPAPGGTQTSTISISRSSSYVPAYMPGLRLYLPLSWRATAGSWSTTYSWSGSAATLVA